jgi:hypothetical protein
MCNGERARDVEPSTGEKRKALAGQKPAGDAELIRSCFDSFPFARTARGRTGILRPDLLAKPAAPKLGFPARTPNLLKHGTHFNSRPRDLLPA